MGNNTPNIPPPDMSESPSDDNRALYQPPPDRHEYGGRSWELPGSVAVSSTVRVEDQGAEQLSFEFKEPAAPVAEIPETPVVEQPRDISPAVTPVAIPKYINDMLKSANQQSSQSNPEGRSDAADKRRRDADVAWLKTQSRNLK